ncbi:MAG TPA: nucleoside hydrolase [Anaerolineae bacterium]|nr:nucleoside hydrolase [Anaerolineae bacterium]
MAPDPNRPPTGAPLPCIIDTDVAIDDWMAMLFLLGHPQVDMRAITVTATGEAHAKPGVRTAQGLLALAGNEGAAVAVGRSTPLRGRQAFPLALRLAMDVRLFLRLPRLPRPASQQGAAALLASQIVASPQPVTIVALGPLTNLAGALLAQPALAGRIARIVIMGGAWRVPGNIEALSPKIDNPHAEWNIFCDPYAAEVVLRCGAPITLMPLDATDQVPLTDDLVRRLAARPSTPASQFVLRAIRRIRPLLRGQTFYLWDPLAAVVAVYPKIVTCEQRRVRVVQEPGRELGRVVEDAEGGAVNIAVQVDRPAFERAFVASLTGEWRNDR